MATPNPTVEEEFKKFIAGCYDGPLPPNQVQHLRMAFYAGTLSCIAYTVETCKGADADKVVATLLDRLNECHSYMLNRVASDFINKLLSTFTSAPAPEPTKPNNPFMDGPRRN